MAKQFTSPVIPVEPTFDAIDDGYLCWWEGSDVVIELHHPESTERRLRSDVVARLGETLIHRSTIDLLSQYDCNNYHAFCCDRDRQNGQINWGAHLTAITSPLLLQLQQRPAAEARTAARPLIINADEVKPQPIQWLWEPYIPRGMLVMLDGDPGLGKGLMLLQVATNLSRQFPFLDQFGKPTVFADVDGPQRTLILSAEDSLPHVMIPRLQRAGADLTRIKFLEGWLGPEDEQHTFDLQHLPVLIRAIEEVSPALVILDPLVAYLGDIDMHRSNETRPLMAALKNVAERYACTILGVRHPSKMDQGGRLMYRGQGNMDIIGAARSGLWVQPHPAHPETQTIMIQSKTNVGVVGRTVIFSREKGEFAWNGVSRLTESMLTGKGPDPWAMLEAFFWLEEHMAPGVPYRSDQLEKEAAELELSERTLKRAKKLLNIRSVKQGEQWYWILPSL